MWYGGWSQQLLNFECKVHRHGHHIWQGTRCMTSIDMKRRSLMYDPFDVCHLGPIRKLKVQRNLCQSTILDMSQHDTPSKEPCWKDIFFPKLCNHGFESSRRPTITQLWRCDFIHISERWLVLYCNPMDRCEPWGTLMPIMHVGWQSLSLGVTNTSEATRGDKEIAIELQSFGPSGLHCTNNNLTCVVPTHGTRGSPNIPEQCAKVG